MELSPRHRISILLLLGVLTIDLSVALGAFFINTPSLLSAKGLLAFMGAINAFALALPLSIVTRVRLLRDDIENIAGAYDSSRRIDVARHGILSLLALSINSLLAAVQKKQEYLIIARESAEASDRAKSSLIDQLRRRDVELVRAKQEAECASRVKSDFLANTSHEIRTPINNIIGFAEMLVESVSRPAEKKQVECILVSATSLLGLINDILDLAKIEANKLELSPVATDLRAYLLRELEPLKGQAEKRNIGLSIEIDNALPAKVMVDALRFRQPVINLISNAMKFTPAGGNVTFRLAVEELTADSTHLHISVSDTGVGISAAAQSKIFEAFEQADTSTTRNYGGTGLGLSISKRIIALMGGTIAVTSKEGAGSTFFFRVSLPIAENVPVEQVVLKKRKSITVGGQEVAPFEDREQLRILVVDDNEPSREICVHRLCKFGMEVSTATNGSEAVELAQNSSFDLILMDCQMPYMDGLQATALIRQHQREYGSHCPIVALTAHAITGYRDICIKAGMDDYLTKPIDESELFDFLDRFFRESKKQPKGEVIPQVDTP
ncbi:MAG: response regulator [Deltaproteobacteria bacterium]|nr:response regulator [Deltaproteobacteria bacterium]